MKTGRRSHTSAALLLSAAVLVSACQRETGAEPLKLTGKMFIFNYRLAYATYMITFRKNASVPDDSLIVATFQNPAGGPPLMLERKLFPKLDTIVLESPDITCVKKATPYSVKVNVRGPDGTVLQTLDLTVISNLDQSILPARALVVGPAYEKNPDVFKDGSAVPDLSEKIACPA